MRILQTLILLLAVTLFYSAGLQAAETQDESSDVGFSIKNMDLTADPRVDFTRYAIGGWLDRTEIPDDKAQVLASNALQDTMDKRLMGIAKSSAAA